MSAQATMPCPGGGQPGDHDQWHRGQHGGPLPAHQEGTGQMVAGRQSPGISAGDVYKGFSPRDGDRAAVRGAGHQAIV